MMVRANRGPFIGLLMVTFTGLGASAALALDDPAGYWATEKHESQIKITHCGTAAICGSVFWMKEPNDPKGNLRLDKENEDEAKRKRPLLGLQLINMKAEDEDWKGTVYNPQNGKTYNATLKMLTKNEVKIEGCVAYVLCGGQKWTREEPRQSGTAASATPHAVTKVPAAIPEATPSE